MATLANDVHTIKRRPSRRKPPVAARVTEAARSLFRASEALSDAASRVCNPQASQRLRRMAEQIDEAVPAIYKLGRTLRRKN